MDMTALVCLGFIGMAIFVIVMSLMKKRFEDSE